MPVQRDNRRAADGLPPPVRQRRVHAKVFAFPAAWMRFAGENGPSCRKRALSDHRDMACSLARTGFGQPPSREVSPTLMDAVTGWLTAGPMGAALACRIASKRSEQSQSG